MSNTYQAPTINTETDSQLTRTSTGIAFVQA